MPCTRLLKSGRILFPANFSFVSLTRFCERFGARPREFCRNSIVRNRITGRSRLIFQSSTLLLTRRTFFFSSPGVWHSFSPFFFSFPLRFQELRDLERAAIRTHVHAHFRNYEGTSASSWIFASYTGGFPLPRSFPSPLFACEGE